MNATDVRRQIFPILLLVGLLAGASAFWRMQRPPANDLSLPTASTFARGAKKSGGPVKPGQLPDKPIPEADTLRLAALSVEQEEEIMDLVRRIVARSPVEALAWAARSKDRSRADLLYLLVIRAWAELDPDAALRWARGPNAPQREQATYAALLGMAQQPDLAIPLVVQLMGKDPAKAGDYGYAFLDDLASTQQFAAAAQFADRSPNEFRIDWMSAVFGRWAGVRPEEAATALEALRGTDSRASAFEAVVLGWAGLRPAGLADYALSLPAGGDERAYALNSAMSAWNLQDPAAFAEWMAQRDANNAEFDAGKVVLAAQTDQVNREPAAAMNWAESIFDPALRYDTAMRVLSDWARTDLQGARDYAENAAWPNDAQRLDLLRVVGIDPNAPLVPVAGVGVTQDATGRRQATR